MSRQFLTNIDFAQNEMQNGVIQNLGTAPAAPAPKKGQMYFNTGDNTLYWYDGSTWASARGGGTGFPGFGAVTQEQTFGATKNDGVGTTTARNDHTHGNPVHDNAAHSGIKLNALAVPDGPINMNGQAINGLPSAAPSNSTDAASKGYVDSVAQGLDPKPSVKVVETTSVFGGGVPSGGVTIDGIAVVNGDRVLLTGQSTPANNGIWVVGTPWTRPTDFDNWSEVPGAHTFAEQGTLRGDTGWVCTADQGGTLGSTANTWSQFSGVGSYVPLTRQIITTPPLQGGGDLSADRTLTIDVFTATVKGAVPPPTTANGKFLRDDATWTVPAGLLSRYSNANVGGSTSQVITHNLAVGPVIVQVYRNASPFDQIECDVEHTSSTTCTLRFATAPAANAFTCVVIG